MTRSASRRPAVHHRREYCRHPRPEADVPCSQPAAQSCCSVGNSRALLQSFTELDGQFFSDLSSVFSLCILYFLSAVQASRERSATANAVILFVKLILIRYREHVRCHISFSSVADKSGLVERDRPTLLRRKFKYIITVSANSGS
jgi:hypothetical protein